MLATGTGIANAAGLGIAAPAVPPNSASPCRTTTTAMAIAAKAEVPRTIFQVCMIRTPISFRRFGVAFDGLSCGCGRAQAAFPQLLDECIEDRDKGEGEDSGGQHAAKYGGADRLPAGGSSAGCKHQRYDAENEGEGSHEDRPQAQTRRHHCSFDNVETVLAPPLGELHDEDRVLGGEADKHDEADLGIDVDLPAAQPQREHRAEERERHRE